MTEYFDFQNLFPLSVIGGWGGERRLNQIHRDGDVSPSVDVHIFFGYVGALIFIRSWVKFLAG